MQCSTLLPEFCVILDNYTTASQWMHLLVKHYFWSMEAVSARLSYWCHRRFLRW